MQDLARGNPKIYKWTKYSWTQGTSPSKGKSKDKSLRISLLGVPLYMVRCQEIDRKQTSEKHGYNNKGQQIRNTTYNNWFWCETITLDYHWHTLPEGLRPLPITLLSYNTGSLKTPSYPLPLPRGSALWQQHWCMLNILEMCQRPDECAHWRFQGVKQLVPWQKG